MTEDDLKHRRRVFGVKAEKDNYRTNYKGEFLLSITHNGWQWQSVALLSEEARKVIEALSEYLEIE